MARVYVAGALIGVGRPQLELYEVIAARLEQVGHEVYLPHRDTSMPFSTMPPEEVYAKDRAAVEASDVIVAVTWPPSTGMGMELEMARERGISVVALRFRDRPWSKMVFGSGAVTKVVDVDPHDGINDAVGWQVVDALADWRPGPLCTTYGIPIAGKQPGIDSPPFARDCGRTATHAIHVHRPSDGYDGGVDWWSGLCTACARAARARNADVTIVLLARVERGTRVEYGPPDRREVVQH